MATKLGWSVSLAALAVACLAGAAAAAPAATCHDVVAGRSYDCAFREQDGDEVPFRLTFDATGDSASVDGVPLHCICSSTGRTAARMRSEAGSRIACARISDSFSVVISARVAKNAFAESTLAFVSGVDVQPSALTCTAAQ